MNPERARKGFNFLAPFYDWGVQLFFGRALWNSQLIHIPHLANSKSLLVFGGGNGRILLPLLEKHPTLKITYLDFSSSMIRNARNRIDRHGLQVDFICGSLQNLNPDQNFDAILTPFVLDCFGEEELASVMFQLNSKLKSEGKWLFSDFASLEKSKTPIQQKLTVQLLYAFFNLFCGLNLRRLPDFERAFSKENLQLIESQKSSGGFFQSATYQKIIPTASTKIH